MLFLWLFGRAIHMLSRSAQRDHAPAHLQPAFAGTDATPRTVLSLTTAVGMLADADLGPVYRPTMALPLRSGSNRGPAAKHNRGRASAAAYWVPQATCRPDLPSGPVASTQRLDVSSGTLRTSDFRLLCFGIDLFALIGLTLINILATL